MLLQLRLLGDGLGLQCHSIHSNYYVKRPNRTLLNRLTILIQYAMVGNQRLMLAATSGVRGYNLRFCPASAKGHGYAIIYPAHTSRSIISTSVIYSSRCEAITISRFICSNLRCIAHNLSLSSLLTFSPLASVAACSSYSFP